MTDRPDLTRKTLIDRRQLLQSVAAGALIATAPGSVRVAYAAGHGPVEMKVGLAVVDQIPDGNGGTKPGPMLRTYNGKTPGPTLSVSPGENLEVSVINTLDAQTAEEFCPVDHNGYHASNTTNLHTHGLHVSPEKATDGRESDNIFLNIVPKGQEVPPACDTSQIRKESAQFNFELPEYHPSGTFWYHAHKHGSTAQQVGNGLVGPLIVKDKPGVMPSYIENAREDILIIQMRDIVEDTPAPGKNGGSPHLVLVDPSGEGGGQVDPVITLRPGEVRRWRIINAAPRADGFVSLNIQDLDGKEAIEVYQIAYDGITYDKRIKIDTNDTRPPWQNPASLSPGNRTDFMIRVPPTAGAGELSLVALQLPTDILHDVAEEKDAATAEEDKNSLKLNIVIAGDPVEDEWSDDPALPGGGPLVTPIDPGEIVKERTVKFRLQHGGGNPTEFLIDDEPFSGKVMQQMKLGTAERWTVTNANSFTHPFHIHVNPFFVTHIDGVELAQDSPLRRWQDTMAIPVAKEDLVDPPGSFTMESRFVKFTGAFVIHCHILEHEDEGMMQKIEVIS